MKRFFSTTIMLFVAIATLSLSSCQKEASELIIGKWNTKVAQLTTTDSQNHVETTDLSPLFKGFEFVEGGAGSAFVQLDPNSTEPTALACTWTIEEEQLNVIITEMEMTMALTITEIDKKAMILDNSSEIFGTTMAMHFEMEKAE